MIVSLMDLVDATMAMASSLPSHILRRAPVPVRLAATGLRGAQRPEETAAEGVAPWLIQYVTREDAMTDLTVWMRRGLAKGA